MSIPSEVLSLVVAFAGEPAADPLPWSGLRTALEMNYQERNRLWTRLNAVGRRHVQQLVLYGDSPVFLQHCDDSLVALAMVALGVDLASDRANALRDFLRARDV